jgi:hypothetical protein
LGVEQNNDVTFDLYLTYNGAAFNPTGYTLTLYLKATETSTDASGTTFTVGAGLTIISAALGHITWKLPHANTGTAGGQWWHLDAVDGGSNRTTLMLGNLTVQAV